MTKLPLPKDAVKDVFLTCIENYRDDALKRRLTGIVPLLSKAEEAYLQKMDVPEVHTIPAHDQVGDVTKREMANVYETKLAGADGPGRKYYNKYMAAPRNGICPYCGVRTVSNLDHFLPKSKYPSLAITPANLVPACWDCNMGEKKTLAPASARETPLHPYFDEVEGARWLAAELSVDRGVLLARYHAIKPDEWDELTFERAAFHLDFFKLKTLYGVHAAAEIENCRRRWASIYRRLGEDGLREEFAEERDSREAVSPSSWQSALYRALSEHTDVVCVWLNETPRP